MSTTQTVKFEPIVIANAIIAWCRRRGENVTPMKLQKLEYYVHAGLLAQIGGEIVGGFEAWPFGPVNRETYFAFRHFGAGSIMEEVDKTLGEEIPDLEEVPCGGEAAWMVDQICSRLGSHDGMTLVRLTHAPESAWYKTVERFKAEEGRDPLPSDRLAILPQDIRDEFAVRFA